MLFIAQSANTALDKKLGINQEVANLEQVELHLLPNTTNKKRFRVKVLGGGCSGFQYKFSIDDNVSDGDNILGSDKIQLEVIVDQHSLPLIANSVIDYSSSIGGEHFFMRNPNAKANCGCGNSFSI